MLEYSLMILLALGIALTFYFTPTLIAWIRRHPDLDEIAYGNFRRGLFLFGWIGALLKALGRIQRPPEVVVPTTAPPEKLPPDPLVDIAARLLELPAANRILSLRLADGRGVQWVVDSQHPLTVRLDGEWSDSEKAAAQEIMQSEVAACPHLARLLDPADPTQGVVLTSGNQYFASKLVRQLITQALGGDPARLTIHKDYEDHDARPEIVDALTRQHGAEIVHQKSGVHVRVSLRKNTDGYRLEIPTAHLDPHRGQRHRARHLVDEINWRRYENDLGPRPDLEEDLDTPGQIWGYSIDRGDVEAAADAALRLLCKIAEAPIDARVSVLPLS